jgi:hypothetical protein
MSAKARGALCLLAAVAAIAALPSGAAAKPAHLRLIAPAARVGTHAFRHRLSLSQLGLELGAFRAPLEIHVWRPRYSRPFRATIVDGRSGAVIRRIPRGFLASNSAGGGSVGVPQEAAKRPPTPPFPRLRGFLHIVFHAHGKVAARGAMPLCPSGLRERVNGGGPDVSRYPPTCSSFSPFVRGLVWGIDRDWAAGILDFGGPDPKVKIDRGRYRVTARISKPYRRLFGISRHHATARLRVYVHGGGPAGGGGKRAAAAMGAPPPPVPKVGRVPRGQRPDLVALPAWNLQTDRQGAHDLLTFSATEWNAGPAPLDVEGFRTAGHDRMRAFEYFRNRRGRVVGREPAGHLEFDSRHGHNHWHFEQFARYSLVRGKTHKVAASHKQSFCIAPTDLIDLTLPGADWMTQPASLTTACGTPTSLWVREVLPAGWGDTYSQVVAGQAFNITHVPNGIYRVRVQVNPRGLLSEGNRDNNSVVRRVHLGGRRGHRTVHAAPWRGIDP